MATLKNIICIFFMAAIFMASALPIPNSKDQNVPWAHPCTPNGQSTEVKANSKVPDFNIAYLTEKVETTQTLLNDLLMVLEEKLADSKVRSFLQMAPVKGFPKVDQSGKQKGIPMYVHHFSQLSKAAVFLEQIQYDGDDEDLRFGLEDLFTENLQQMCEIHLALTNQSTRLPLPASRSVMSPELRNLGTSYEHYKRNYQIMYQYKLLLKSHLAQYQQITGKSPNPHFV